VNASDETVAFTDTSQPGAGGAAIRVQTWQFDDPDSGLFDTSTQADPMHRFSAPGVYTVSLTVTDANELTSTSTQTVTVPPPAPPPAALRGPA
jgi:PKD repeat protein